MKHLLCRQRLKRLERCAQWGNRFLDMKPFLAITTVATLLTSTAFAGPIHDAAFIGNDEAVQDELDAGVDVNMMAENGGGTALHFAASKGRLSVVELLVDNKADLNARNNKGWTPLISASSGGHLEIVDLLIESGADVNVLGHGRGSALHYAALGVHLDIIELLIANGSYVNVRDTNGNTPLNWSSNKPQSNSLLRSYGGRTGEEELQYQLKSLQDSFAKLKNLIISDENVVVDQPSIKRLQGVFVIQGNKGKKYAVEYHTGDNNWKPRETVTLSGNSQIYIDSSSYDEKRFYRIKLVN